jgi:hypothetical protein
VSAVAAGPGGTAWLAGYTTNADGTSNTVVEKWNGTSWSVVKAGLGGGQLSNVRIASDGDVWVVGAGNNPVGSTASAVIAYEHGGTWTSLHPPVDSNSGIAFDSASDILAASPTDVWVVGQGYSTLSKGYGPAAERLDGTTWSAEPQPEEVGENSSISPGSSGKPEFITGTYYSDLLHTTSYEYYSSSGSWAELDGATALGNAAAMGAVTAHIPGTNATWAAGGTYDFGPGSKPIQAFIEYNPGS